MSKYHLATERIGASDGEQGAGWTLDSLADLADAQAVAEDELRLECRCADDRGAGYKDESELTDDDVACIEDYEETRAAQLAMAAAAKACGIEHYVADSDDRDSRHSDAYVYFPPSRLAEVAEMLDSVGLHTRCSAGVPAVRGG